MHRPGAAGEGFAALAVRPRVGHLRAMADAAARLNAALSDRYRIERELGQGGMATVYLADRCSIRARRTASCST